MEIKLVGLVSSVRETSPIQWSTSSVIYTAHPTSPLVVGHHFSSSKQFILPSSSNIIASPNLFDPPSVISVCQTDDWLFAYFPRKDGGEGIGCIWDRGPQIDSWNVKECWYFEKAAGAVTAIWLDQPRQWALSSMNTLSRLPPTGPNFFISRPVLVLITQDMQIHIHLFRNYESTIRSVKRSLFSQEHSDHRQSTRQCISASISAGYNEVSSIVVATHCRRMPPLSTKIIPPAPLNFMDQSIPIPVNAQVDIPDQRPIDWESWGEEATIDVVDIIFRLDNSLMMVAHTTSTIECRNNQITDIRFVSLPPQPQSSGKRELNQSPSIRRAGNNELGKMFLAVTSLDFHEYSTPPTSEVTLYPLNPVNPKADFPNIVFHSVMIPQATSRVFDSGVVAHLESYPYITQSSTGLLNAYIINTGPSPVKTSERNKTNTIGSIRVLNVPDLTDNADWQSVPVKCNPELTGRTLPLFGCISPNNRLICILSSSSGVSQPSLSRLPVPIAIDHSDLWKSYIAAQLTKAGISNISVCDLAHTLTDPRVSVNDVSDILLESLRLGQKTGVSYNPIYDLLGICVEVYRRQRTKHSKDESDKSMYKQKSEVAHDIFSILTCWSAFQQCLDGEAYDLDAVWHLIATSTWIVNYTEKLMTTCVLSFEFVGDPKHAESEAAIVEKASPCLNTPAFLLLCYPSAITALVKCLKHLKTFRNYLGSFPAGGDAAHMAQTVLVDLIDCSGVDFGALLTIFEECLPLLSSIDATEHQRGLTLCQPSPSTYPYLCKLLHKVTQTSGVLNRSALLLKASDMVDGIMRLSLGDSGPQTVLASPFKQKDEERDVVTKGVLTKNGPRDICLRCGGKTCIDKKNTTSAPSALQRWDFWERKWFSKCICGGVWMRTNTATMLQPA
ncbi:hypothetical protein CVT24_007750 [Panaeolus cyanescens]|uniref:Mediator complex subunit 16 C-terminal domain-containing protein n=1 Tax=Panaeolus cyanescens TaxID=181874 RepID=A0A409YM24_9AGAR|nr:hypothetical protein CVT24_007750 [Panaeolus cyanescens]